MRIQILIGASKKMLKQIISRLAQGNKLKKEDVSYLFFHVKDVEVRKKLLKKHYQNMVMDMRKQEELLDSEFNRQMEDVRGAFGNNVEVV
jgi:hypothetical protein